MKPQLSGNHTIAAPAVCKIPAEKAVHPATRILSRNFFIKLVMSGLAAVVLFLPGTAQASVRLLSGSALESRVFTVNSSVNLATSPQNANLMALIPGAKAGDSLASLVNRISNATNIDYLSTSLIALTSGLLALACRHGKGSTSKWCPHPGPRTHGSEASGRSSRLD